MDEASARRVVLAQAIEETQAQPPLLSAAERDAVDVQARRDALAMARGATAGAEFLRLRADRLIGAVADRHPQLALLQQRGAWSAWIEWLVPLAAFAAGVSSDVVGDPHRINLVSLPLLGVVAWNLVMYLALFVALFLPRRTRTPWTSRIGHLGDGFPRWAARANDAAAQAAVRFRVRWLEASRPLHVARVKRVLHLAAAAWAAGLIASLLVRGLVVEYRVGWESTFLGPAQVYAILSVLRVPALVVFPFDTFSIIDIARLRFSDGGGLAGGAQWVWMYVALLITVVILPRLVLATWSAWRETRLERRFPLALEGPYFERVLSALESTRVRLGLLAHREEDRALMLRVLGAQASSAAIPGSTEFGDVLELIQLDAAAAVPETTPTPWWKRWWSLARQAEGADPVGQQTRMQLDLVVHVIATAQDEAEGSALLQRLGLPVLRVANGTALADALDARRFARAWPACRSFFAAVRTRLPARKVNGFERLVRAWKSTHEARMDAAMSLLARHLLACAAAVERVAQDQLSARSLLPSQRDAQALAREAAMHAVLERVEQLAAQFGTALHDLYGLHAAAAPSADPAMAPAFDVRQSVDTHHAGMAGAASGAAMGASLDLLAGGLTLGAAAALGALIGGGAAYVAAAWRNRTAPDGATSIQLSDAMMLALARGAFLHWVRVIHASAPLAGSPPDIAQEAVAGVLSARDGVLAGWWSAARASQDGSSSRAPLAAELGLIAREISKRLYEES